MTPRAQGTEWAEKVVAEESFYEPSIARSVVVVDDVVKLIRKQHARAVRIVKAEIKRVKLDQFSFTAGSKDSVLNELQRVLELLQRGRGGKG